MSDDCRGCRGCLIKVLRAAKEDDDETVKTYLKSGGSPHWSDGILPSLFSYCKERKKEKVLGIIKDFTTNSLSEMKDLFQKVKAFNKNHKLSDRPDRLLPYLLSSYEETKKEEDILRIIKNLQKCFSPLNIAIQDRSLSEVRDFIQKGADPNEAVCLGMSPLLMAVMDSWLEGVRLFCDNGADIEEFLFVNNRFIQEEQIRISLPILKILRIRQCLTCLTLSMKGSHYHGRCGMCKKAYYCSRECQLADWKFHKKECS